MREVSIANRHPRLRVNRREVARLIETLDANASAIGIRSPAVSTGELSLVFLTDAALAKLHADFLDDPTTTDVITFEGDAEHHNNRSTCNQKQRKQGEYVGRVHHLSPQSRARQLRLAL